MSVLISDESINSYGFYLSTAGADLKQFKKNPILLWMHNRAFMGKKEEVLPIGKVDNIRIEGDKILGDPVFDLEDDFAAEIARKWEAGILRMVSPGLSVIAISDDPKTFKKGQTRATVTQWKLKELSIVDIGSNDNALALYDDQDKLIKLSDDPGQDMPIKLINNQTDKNMEFLTLADNTELTTEKAQILYDEHQAQAQSIVTLTAERDSYKTKADAFELAEKTAKETEKTTLLAAAEKDGRINADIKEQWVTFFDSNFEAAKKALAAIPVRKLVSDQLNNDQNLTERERFEKLTWDQMDRSGELEVLKANHPDLFEAKKAEKFPK